MPYLTQLAAVARRTGYPVSEVGGWKTRGHGPQPEVEGVVCHHTATPGTSGDYPTLAVVRDGYAGLPGPLSHFGLGRSGRIYVIAAGKCYHNAPSTSPYHDNSSSIGIEAENNGKQAWPAVQLDAYRKLCAELCREFELPVSRVKAHREVNTAKPDPHSISMSAFRAEVARLIVGEDDMPAPKDLWEWDGIAAPPWQAEKGNTNWTPAAYLHWGYRALADTKSKVAELEAKVAEQGAKLDQILAAVTPKEV